MIRGGAGKDLLTGGHGDDRIFGGKGADRILGQGGKDSLRGGQGPDTIYGNEGDDRLFGEPQNDYLAGGPGDDFLDGGSGANRIDGGPGTNRCLSTAADTLAGTCDGEGPVVSEVVITPATIDTSGQDRKVEVTWRVTDNLSGINLEFPMVGAYHGTGNLRPVLYAMAEQTGGDKMNATFKATFNVPRYSPQGHWSLDFQFRDKIGNYARFEADELAKLGLPTGFDQVGPGDNGPPTLVSMSIDRNSVDTSGADQTINATLRVKDDLTGVNMESSNGVGMVAYHRGRHQFNYGNCERTSGDALDGIYQCELPIRRYSAKGTWELRVGMRDHAGYESVLGPDSLPRMGFPSTIQQTGIGDEVAPKLAEFTVSPNRIDTTNEPQTVNFRLRLTDDLSGIADGDNYYLWLYVNGVQTDHHAELTRVAGGPLNSTYEGSIVMPKGSVHGSWTPIVWLVDNANNVETLYGSDLLKLGFPSGFTNGP